ncbi:MAG: DUF4402 domain-containing protein [Marinilabiliales bacterium]|nr:DUF4402 domain-containing protein [Marinilabiliales bacterium]
MRKGRKKIDNGFKSVGRVILAITWMLLFPVWVSAQKLPEKPPIPVKLTVSTLQHLDFGKIIPTGVAGSVKVPPSGIPVIQNVFLISIPTPGLIDVECLPGSLINISFPSIVTLTRSGPGTLDLINLISDHSPSFITKSAHTFVYFGGTLQVNTLSANPGGSYGGSIPVTFTLIHQ